MTEKETPSVEDISSAENTCSTTTTAKLDTNDMKSDEENKTSERSPDQTKPKYSIKDEFEQDCKGSQSLSANDSIDRTPEKSERKQSISTNAPDLPQQIKPLGGEGNVQSSTLVSTCGEKSLNSSVNKSKVLVNVIENSLYEDFRVPEMQKPKNQVKTAAAEPSKTQNSTTNNVMSSKQETFPSNEPGDLSHLLSIKSFSNTVDVQINEVKYTCSGAVLSAQSPVFSYQLSKGASIIVLEGLACKRGEESVVEECLLLLYGGGVVLCDRNIPLIVRFSVLYQIDNMYRLALHWVRNCISVTNVYPLWLLGSEPAVAGKTKRRKNDLLHITRRYVRGREVEVALQLRRVKERGEELREEFILLMLQYTDCASSITDLL